MNLKKIYIQLKDECFAKTGDKIVVKDLAVILAQGVDKEKILQLKVLDVPNDKQYEVVSILTVIEEIKKKYPDLDIFPLANSEILIKISEGKQKNKLIEILKTILVCIIIFIGTAFALMNFHEDVNMADVQARIYKILTGIENKSPLIMQIPYSLGIGLGVAVFFNHISVNKYKKEPSPMDIEIGSYKKNIYDYILQNEKNTEEK